MAQFSHYDPDNASDVSEEDSEVDSNEGSDVEDYEEEGDEAESPIGKETLEQARAALWREKFQTDNDVDTFLDKYGSVIYGGDKHGSLLHTITGALDSPDVKAADMEKLIQHLLAKRADLLCYCNETGENALYSAILKKQSELVGYMEKYCSDKSAIAEALMKASGGSRQNCLHVAFKHNLSDEIIQRLLDAVEDDALEATDKDRKTPLHYAVNYRDCSNARTKLIFSIIQRDRVAIEKQHRANPNRPFRTFLDNMDSQSVYLEHRNTLQQFSERRESAKLKEKSKAAGEAGKRSDPSGTQASARSSNTKDRSSLRDARSENVRGGAAAPEGKTRRLADTHAEEHQKGSSGKTQPSQGTNNKDAAVEKNREKRRDRDSEGIGAPQKDSHLTSGGDLRPETSSNMSLKRTSTMPMNGSSKPSKKSAAKKATGEKTLVKNSKKILLELKLHYLRTRRTESAISFLYGKNTEGKKICFDYHGLRLDIKGETFNKTFGKDQNEGIKFDEVLQFVSFPQVNLSLGGKLAAQKPPGSQGRNEMRFFFNWLFAKGVRHIIKVKVDDTGETAHSEESIKDCLQGFIIEHLDWRKLDLDPCVIRAVGTKSASTDSPPSSGETKSTHNLTELSLRWSGNNAVLRAWSEKEGLAALPYLKRIHLHVPSKTYDSGEWISQKIKEFKARLNENRNDRVGSALNNPDSQIKEGDIPEPAKDPPRKKPVEVFKVYEGRDEERKVLSNDSPEAVSSDTRDRNSHRWLDSTDRFADHLKRIWDTTCKKYRNLEMTRSGLDKEVIVALIDDGVDPFDPSIDGHIEDGASFDYKDGRQEPYYVSKDGHGTVMASMIKRVCPIAKIYPIRLQVTDDGEKKIVVKSVIKAIHAALDKGANIISMSWTVPVPDETDRERRQIRDVLQRACDKNIAMFCSSPDSGQFTTQDYPSAYNRDKFFRIGAANHDGTMLAAAGLNVDLDFIFPGVEVVQRAGSSNRYLLPDLATTMQPSTGSSVATALAAGLAATIVYCAKAGAMTLEMSGNAMRITPMEVQKLSERDGMKKAFSKLGTITDSKFIPVWESFDRLNRIFIDDSETDQEKDRELSSMALTLVRAWSAGG